MPKAEEKQAVKAVPSLPRNQKNNFPKSEEICRFSLLFSYVCSIIIM